MNKGDSENRAGGSCCSPRCNRTDTRSDTALPKGQLQNPARWIKAVIPGGKYLNMVGNVWEWTAGP